MIEFIVHLFVTAGLLLVVGRVVDGIRVGSGSAALLGALILGIANAVVRPVVVLLTLPLTVLTLGLFLFVVNALMLMLAAALVPNFTVRGFGPALVGSLLLSLMNLLVSWIFGL